MKPGSLDTFRIEDAETPYDFDSARKLFEEYQALLGVDLCFQGFADELNNLRAQYSPPAGCLLLAHGGQELAGCVAVRALNKDHCEMKRLYVRPAHRGSGLGRLLAQRLLERARSLGYRYMVLDTLDSMETARALYARLGFRETEPYYQNPLPGVHYMKLDLAAHEP